MHNHSQSLNTPAGTDDLGVDSYRFIHFKFSSGDPVDADLQAVSQWLTKHLHVDLFDLDGDSGDPRWLLIFQQLCLAVTLLQAARIPIFAAPKIVGINSPSSSSPSRWSADVLFPWLEGVPLDVLTLSLQCSQKLLPMVNAAIKLELSNDDIYDWITVHAIDKIKAYAPSTKSTLHILRCAYQNKIPFSHLGLWIFLLGTGSRSRLIRGSVTEGDSMISGVAALDKRVTHHILKAAGLPVPAQQTASSLEEVLRVATQLKWPLVVKPINLDRGEGVTINIKNEAQLVQASETLLKDYGAKQIILEEMQPGRCHRLVIVNQQLVYAVIRLPVAVFGDGRSTIKQLIELARQADLERPPWLRSGDHYECDSITEEVLAISGYTYSTIPKQGEVVNLRLIESTQWGGRTEDLTSSLHPDNIALAVAAADALRLSIAGVDIMSTDLTVAWHRNGASINEVNSAPSIGGSVTSKTYLPTFLRCLLGPNPTIPIERYDQRYCSLAAAKVVQAKKRGEGLRSFIVSPDGCFDPTGNQMAGLFQTTQENVRALLRNRNVDHLILIE